MYQCAFELNNQSMSAFKIGTQSFLAFSGLVPYVNKRISACVANSGPIPPGTYCIVDRGISKGCITIDKQSDFNFIRAILKNGKKEAIRGTTILAYGKVVVT